MVSITDRKDGTAYRGYTVDSAVRRVWGRSARVGPGERIGDGIVAAMVTRTDRYGTHVLAEVLIRPGVVPASQLGYDPALGYDSVGV